jgi:hypothetical protein
MKCEMRFNTKREADNLHWESMMCDDVQRQMMMQCDLQDELMALVTAAGGYWVVPIQLTKFSSCIEEWLEYDNAAGGLLMDPRTEAWAESRQRRLTPQDASAATDMQSEAAVAKELRRNLHIDVLRRDRWIAAYTDELRSDEHHGDRRAPRPRHQDELVEMIREHQATLAVSEQAESGRPQQAPVARTTATGAPDWERPPLGRNGRPDARSKLHRSDDCAGRVRLQDRNCTVAMTARTGRPDKPWAGGDWNPTIRGGRRQDTDPPGSTDGELDHEVGDASGQDDTTPCLPQGCGVGDAAAATRMMVTWRSGQLVTCHLAASQEVLLDPDAMAAVKRLTGFWGGQMLQCPI